MSGVKGKSGGQFKPKDQLRVKLGVSISQRTRRIIERVAQLEGISKGKAVDMAFDRFYK